VTGRPSNDCLAVERVDDLMESVVLRPRLTKRRDDAVFLAVSLTPGQTRGVDSSTTTPSDSIYIDLLISLYALRTVLRNNNSVHETVHTLRRVRAHCLLLLQLLHVAGRTAGGGHLSYWSVLSLQ